MADNLFGWDLIYRCVENQLAKKEDLLVAFAHWFLIKNGFSCIGNGNSKVLNGDEVKSEVLSPGWNLCQDYNIRYVQENRLYLLRASVTDDDIIFNFLRSDDLCISSCVFKIEETVKDIKGNITVTIPNHKNVMRTLRRDLIDPVFTKSTTSVAGTQTTDPSSNAWVDPYCPDRVDPSRSSLRIPQRRPTPTSPPDFDPLRGDPIRGPPRDPLRDPLSVGRSDLDPFGRGGGMIFDPFGPRTERRDPVIPGPSFPGGLPRGSVPPGARFDPFGPPGTGRGGGRADPDPDHLPPPGYDDMFM